MFLFRAFLICLPLLAIQGDGTTPSTTQPGSQAACTCGPQNPSQGQEIFSGRVAKWHPWFAVVIGSKGPFATKRCSGTLIGRRHVITAAHCVILVDKNSNAIEELLPKHMTVILGAHKNTQEQNSENIQRVRSKQFFFHPMFLRRKNESVQTQDWDVLIIRLDMDSPAKLDRGNIAPACLPQPEYEVFGRLTVVQGMGNLDTRKTKPKELMEINDFKVNDKGTQNTLKRKVITEIDWKNRTKWVLGPETFIATNQKKGVMPGDSGGPMLSFSQFYSLVGVTSWALDEPWEGKFYSGFVSVMEALPWIKDTLMEVDDLNCKPLSS